MPDVIRAAGGVVVRDQDGNREVLVVHRPRYDDWSLPKGKLDDGETDEDAARREVHEETGWQCTLGRELPQVSYVDRRGRDKIVRYWQMTPVDRGKWTPNDEVDEVRWIRSGETALLSYDVDRRLVTIVLGDSRGGAP
ncbi:MAG TPA: NUDIX hydrolase [Acidimicrobiia bacterium]|nr:NUDIX hydrolase [Acidimicrobiia bacterium]